MTDQPTVWIGEAYDGDGVRVERVVHCTREDARHDIETLAPRAGWYDIQRKPVYTGRHGQVPAQLEERPCNA